LLHTGCSCVMWRVLLDYWRRGPGRHHPERSWRHHWRPYHGSLHTARPSGGTSHVS
jgi:hypothetical protein